MNYVILTLLFYAFLTAAHFGWGKAFIVTVTRNESRTENVPLSFLVWTGWAFTLLLFQFVHFFLPINIYSVGPILFIGAAFSLAFLLRTRPARCGLSLFTGCPSRYAVTGIVFGLLLAASWLAARAMLPIDNYDSGLYHLNAIRWTNEYPLVPGLGNLHGRLAFNSSFFTYVAALNLHPLFGNGRSVANSFLILLTVATLLELLSRFLRRPSLVLQSPPIQWATPLFCLPYIAYWALSSNGVSAPSPDLTSSLLQVTIFVVFVRLLARIMEDRTVPFSDSLILSLLAATAITVKLSNVAFCGTIMVLVMFGILSTARRPLNHAVRFVLPLVVVLMVFCVRGIVLSGAPLYPSTIGYINAEWSVPLKHVTNERNWVYSWARQPKIHWEQVLGSWAWFEPWFQSVVGRTIDVVFPLAVFLVCSALALVVPCRLERNRFSRQCLLSGIILTPIWVALVFWFLTAPAPRFANASFMLLAVSAIVSLLSNIQLNVSRRGMFTVICIIFVVANLNLLYWAFSHRWTVTHVSVDGWHKVNRVPLNEKVTSSGLRVYVPVSGDQCWDAPLPCTPYFHKGLRLRDPDNVASGFTVRPLENNEKIAEQESGHVRK